MSAHPPRLPGVVLNHSSHRSIAALTACVITAISNGASMPYLTMSEPEPMRQALPPPVATPVLAVVPLKGAPDDKTDSTAPPPAAAPATPVATAATTPAPDTTPPKTAPAPKVELVPDTVPASHTRLEDILPFFVPPAAPASRATYEEK